MFRYVKTIFVASQNFGDTNLKSAVFTSEQQSNFNQENFCQIYSAIRKFTM